MAYAPSGKKSAPLSTYIPRMPLNTRSVPDPPQPGQALRLLRLRYAGICTRCGKSLAKGQQALYDSSAKTVRCVVCEVAAQIAADVVDRAGVAGRSAHEEYERRHFGRQDRVKSRLGDILGGVVLAITEDPQSTRSWERGSIGEQKLAEALAGVRDIMLLHDRRVPRTRANIDHIVVAPAGVFVVDAKFYKGKIQIRDIGGWFKTDNRLYVGSRDCSHLAENMGWQVEAVQRALTAAGFQPLPPITPVICFIDGDWPLIFPPEEYKGVRLEGMRSIKKQLAGTPVLEPQMIPRIHQVLAAAFPPK
jgi:Nuclease-related domain